MWKNLTFLPIRMSALPGPCGKTGRAPQTDASCGCSNEMTASPSPSQAGSNSDCAGRREQSLSFDLLSTCVKIPAQPLAWTSRLLGLSFLICDLARGRGWVQRAAGPWQPRSVTALNRRYVRTCADFWLARPSAPHAVRAPFPLPTPPRRGLLSPFKHSQPFRVQKKTSGGLGSSPSHLYDPSKFWLGKRLLADSPDYCCLCGNS